MLIAATKLADIAARSLFVLLVLYALPVRSTGQFGLALTLIGFFTFGVGFERYADLQRRIATTTPEQTDRLIISTLRFYAVNHALGLPVLLGLLAWWVKLPVPLVLLCGLIAVVEHLSNEVYRIALIAPRHRLVLFAVLGKNLCTLALVSGLLWLRPASFDIDSVLAAWGAASLAGLLAISIGFSRTWAFADLASVQGAGLRQFAQYRASRTHVLIGLVALAALQADRLVAGALLSLELSGLYFRHIFLASFAYQVFNVASYNRLAPRVYALMHGDQAALARQAVRRELQRLVPAAAVVVLLFYALLLSGLGDKPSLQSINPHFLAVLTLGYLVRAFADFNALLLNAAYAERDVFKSQATALALAVACNILLTHWYGIAGTVCTLVLGSAAYLLMSSVYTQRNAALHSRAPA
jgi:hypothetical protein